jgi:Cdc6-like AAA superfamily ATPase
MTIVTVAKRIDIVHDGVKNIKQQQCDQEQQAILKWLTSADYSRQQNDFIARRQKGTGEWLLKSDEFQQWLTHRGQTLFCPGMPGAGKTIITSIVVRHLHNLLGSDSDVGIAYLYCNFRQQHEQKSIDLIMSLLKQLVRQRPSLLNVVKSFYDIHKPKHTRPSFDEFLKVFQDVAASYSRTFIIVDALDECQISHEGRGMFMQEIFNIQSKLRVNIFVTSRFIQEIEARFDKSIRLEIRASNDDVQKYLDQKLQNATSTVLKDHSLQGEIKSKITQAAGGMYVFSRKIIILTNIHQVSPCTALY